MNHELHTNLSYAEHSDNEEQHQINYQSNNYDIKQAALTHSQSVYQSVGQSNNFFLIFNFFFLTIWQFVFATSTTALSILKVHITSVVGPDGLSVDLMISESKKLNCCNKLNSCKV